MKNTIPDHATALGAEFYVVKRQVIGTPYVSHCVHRITGELIGKQISPPTFDDARRMDAEFRAAKETTIARTRPQLTRHAKGHA